MLCLCLRYVYVLVSGLPKWCIDTRNFEMSELFFWLQVLRNIYEIISFFLGQWTCILFLQLMSHFTEHSGEEKELVIPS